MTYKVQTFNIPNLTDISVKTVENHLLLYKGYVSNVNFILEKLDHYNKDCEKNKLEISELQRRLGFEFGGMRNHEYYFSQFEKKPTPLSSNRLRIKIENQWGSFDNWLRIFKNVASIRGVGWAMLCYDNKTDKLINVWIDEQHLGQLVAVDIILALDMWEHSYLQDYPSNEKGKYIEAFFSNLNWEIISSRLI